MIDPPDPYLTDLAARINKAARAGRVLFFVQGGEHSVIFQHGPKRAVIPLGGRPSDADIDAIKEAVESWSGFGIDEALYSTEPPKSPDSEWA